MEYLITITKYILEGAVLTAKIWLFTMIISIPISIFLAVIYEQGRNKRINYLINGFTTMIRGTPLLFQLYFVYYGLPILANIKFEPLTAAVLTFSFSWIAYLTEIFRGGIKSVDIGQYDAAFVLGLSKYQTMRYIILPQALIAVIPSISNQSLSLVYSTALVSTIGLSDILKNAKVTVIRDFRMEAFLIAGIIYLIIGIVFIKLSKVFESYFSRYKLK
jgi:polar amino acid transport system permease protein